MHAGADGEDGLVISVEEHKARVREVVGDRPVAKRVLSECAGLVLAEDVAAHVSLPPFDNSAMDGYAVRADAARAGRDTPVKLPVAEDIPAGRTDSLTLTPGTAHRIMTGAPMPVGANSRGPGRIHRRRHRRPWRSGRRPRPASTSARAGEDVTAGTTVLRAGQVVSPAALGLAAALGVAELPVCPASGCW